MVLQKANERRLPGAATVAMILELRPWLVLALALVLALVLALALALALVLALVLALMLALAHLSTAVAL